MCDRETALRLNRFAAAAPFALVVVVVLAIVVTRPQQADSAIQDTPLTTGAYVRSANAFCRTANRQIEAILGQPKGRYYTRAEVEAWARILRGQEHALAGLRPPAVLVRSHTKMIEAARTIPSLVLAADTALRAKNATRFESINSRVEKLADERSRLAKQMGLTICAAQ